MIPSVAYVCTYLVSIFNLHVLCRENEKYDCTFGFSCITYVFWRHPPCQDGREDHPNPSASNLPERGLRRRPEEGAAAGAATRLTHLGGHPRTAERLP